MNTSKEIKVGNYKYNGMNIKFNYCTTLSYSEKLNFVNTVSDIVLDEHRYNYIIKDLIFDYIIIKMFTDIDLSEINESPNNIDAIEDFVTNTMIVDTIKANSEGFIIDELMDAVNKNLEYKTGVKDNAVTNALSSLLKVIENKIESLDTDVLVSVASKLNDASGELTADKLLEAYSKTDMFKANDKKRNNKIKRK